jgi:hypothetical protein
MLRLVCFFYFYSHFSTSLSLNRFFILLSQLLHETTMAKSWQQSDEKQRLEVEKFQPRVWSSEIEIEWHPTRSVISGDASTMCLKSCNYHLLVSILFSNFAAAAAAALFTLTSHVPVQNVSVHFFLSHSIKSQ